MNHSSTASQQHIATTYTSAHCKTQHIILPTTNNTYIDTLQHISESSIHSIHSNTMHRNPSTHPTMYPSIITQQHICAQYITTKHHSHQNISHHNPPSGLTHPSIHQHNHPSNNMSKSITNENDIVDEVMEDTESMTDVDDVDLCFILTLLYASVQELTSSHFVQSELNSPKQQDQSACEYYKRKRLELARRVYPQWSEIKLDTSDSIFCRKF